MEIRDIIIIIMFIQLVIISYLSIRNAELIKMVDDKHDLIEKELSNIINEK